MSDQEKFTEALAAHIAGALYSAASPDQQRSAIAMAKRDILSQTGPAVDQEDPLFIDAVAEQTIFLLLNVDKLYSPLNDLVSESVEGAGSVTYDRENRPSRFISPRALQLCCKLNTGTLPLLRG